MRVKLSKEKGMKRKEENNGDGTRRESYLSNFEWKRGRFGNRKTRHCCVWMAGWDHDVKGKQALTHH